MSQFLKENWFKLGILVALLLIAWAVYQALVIEPANQRAAAEAKTTLEEIAKQDIEAQRQTNIDACLSGSFETYSRNWNNSCRTLGKLSTKCETLLFSDDAQDQYISWHPELASSTIVAQSLAFNKAKQDCSCTLPSTASDRWDDTYKQDQQACYDRYK